MAIRGTGESKATRGWASGSGVGVATAFLEKKVAAPGTIVVSSITSVNYSTVSGAPYTFPDNGGFAFVLTGTFPADTDIVVEIDDGAGVVRECYGGANLNRDLGLSTVGRGYICRSTDGTTLKAVCPPMPVGTGYDVIATIVGGASDTLVGQVNVEKRSYWTTIHELRRNMAPDVYDIGPGVISGEEV